MLMGGSYLQGVGRCNLKSSGYLRKLSKQTDEARVDATLNSLVLQGEWGSGSR